MEVLVAPLLAVVIILALVKLVSFPFWLLKNSIIGAVMLYIGNFLGLFALKLTFLNCLIAGILGIPGVILLLIYTHFLK